MTSIYDLRLTFIRIFWTFGRQFAGGIAQLITLLLISRELGASGAGNYAIVYMLPSLLAEMSKAGLPTANVYFITSGYRTVDEVWHGSLRAFIVLACFGLLLGIALLNLLGNVIFSEVPMGLLHYGLWLYPFLLAINFQLSIFLAMKDFDRYNIIILLRPIGILAILVFAWLVTSITLKLAIEVLLFANIAITALGFFLLRKHVLLFTRGNVTRPYIKEALRYGVKAHLSNMTAFLNYRVDLFLVNFFYGPSAAGIYNTTISLTEQLWMVSKAYATVMFPTFSTVFKDGDAQSDLTSIMSWTVLWGTFVASIALIFLSYPLINLGFGKEFSDSFSTLILLLPGVVAFASVRVLASEMIARGRVTTNLYISTFVLVVNIIANLILIPSYSVHGAAVATTIAYILNLAIRLAIYKVQTNGKWWRLLLPVRSDIDILKSALKSRRA